MPNVVFHKLGVTYSDQVPDNTNLVVNVAIKRFPFPHLTFGCGMGKCAKCACRVLRGADNLPEPNWKEQQRLGPRIGEGYRLACQLWLHHDIELEQDAVPQPAWKALA